MAFDDLSNVASLTLAGSLAMERLVVLAKTSVPWLAEPKVTLPGQSEMRVDRVRRRTVLGITLVASLITAFFICSGTDPINSDTIMKASMSIGSNAKVHWTIFGLMISGGSAFWTSIVAFASATKDIKNAEKSVTANATNAAAAVAAPDLTVTPRRVVPSL